MDSATTTAAIQSVAEAIDALTSVIVWVSSLAAFVALASAAWSFRKG